MNEDINFIKNEFSALAGELRMARRNFGDIMSASSVLGSDILETTSLMDDFSLKAQRDFRRASYGYEDESAWSKIKGFVKKLNPLRLFNKIFKRKENTDDYDLTNGL